MAAFIVPGHGLVAEGAAFTPDGNRVRWNSTGGVGSAMCSCGAVSEPKASGQARKAWHKAHKRQVVAATPIVQPRD